MEHGDARAQRQQSYGRRLVLVGGGHAHVEVLRRWRRRPLAGVEMTLIVDQARAVYSGMVPGYVAGDYRREDIEIDVAALARAAGARLVEAPASWVDPQRRCVGIAEGAAAASVMRAQNPPAGYGDDVAASAAVPDAVAYDVASIDVGSSVRGLDLPGVREFALSTRPIGKFVGRVDEAVERRLLPGRRHLRVAVIGNGMAAFEMAFTLGSRLSRRGASADVVVVGESEQDVVGCSPALARRIGREASRRNVRVLRGLRACGVDDSGVLLADARQWRSERRGDDAPRSPARAASEAPHDFRVDADLVVWATGAAPPALATRSRLARDERGFLRVRPSLQVAGCDDLFAAGDCASIEGAPWVPKAGVYAVRQGPLLDANLRARLQGRTLRDFRPQRRHLSILYLGDGRALAGWGRLALAGRAAWLLKDRIDRRFVARYRS